MKEKNRAHNTSNKTIAKNVAFLYMRLIFMLLIGLFTSRVIIDQLGFVDYGLTNVVGSLIVIFSFVSGALASSASRFMALEVEVGTPDSQNRVFSMTLNIHLLFSIIVFVLAETIGLWFLYNMMVIPEERMGASSIVYQLSCLSAILSILVVPYRALIIANEQMKAFAYLSIFEVLAKLVVAFCLSYGGIDKLILMGILTFLIQVSINLLYFLYCKRNFTESHYRKIWDKVMFKDMMGFSGWSTLGYVSSSVVNQAYNLILNMFCGPVINAARAVAYQVQMKVTQFATNFQTALNPQIVKNYAANDKQRVEDLINMSIKMSFSLMFIMLFPILVNVDGVLSLWLVDVPSKTNVFAILVCLSSILDAMSNPFGVVAEAANQLKKMTLFVTPIFLLTLPIAYICLLMGLPSHSVFVVALIAQFVHLWVKFLIARNLIACKLNETIQLMWKCILSLSLFVIIGGGLKLLFDDSFLSVIICGSICLFLSSIWILYVIINKRERLLVYNKILSFIRNKIEK